MAYGANINQRIDRLETIICEKITELMETGSECIAENAYEEAEEIGYRIDTLELRLERLAHISAKYSAQHLI